MEREPNVFGHDLTPEERAGAAISFERLSQEGLKPVEGEIEKPAELRQFIDLVGGEKGFLNQELEAMGLKGFAFDPQRVHILPSSKLAERFPDAADVNGFYGDISDGIYVNADLPRLALYKSVLHEMVHQTSFRSFYADKGEHTWRAQRMRTGYRSHHPTESGHEHFQGLNEAVVDRIVRDIFRTRKEQFEKAFRVSEEETRQPVFWYDEEMDVLDAVIAQIAKNKNERPEAVWIRFKKGEFTGEMMHLRDVDDSFGKGALRVLGAMDSGTNDEDAEVNRKILDYFSDGDETTRDSIAKDILTKRERSRYEQRKGSVGRKFRIADIFGFVLGR